MGVFFGFSPFLGFHTLLAIIVAFLFNLNRVAALLGVYSNLPWIIAPYYAIVTMIGAKIVGTGAAGSFKTQLSGLFELSVFHGEFWQQLITILKPLAVAVHRWLVSWRDRDGGDRLSAGAGVRDKSTSHP